MLYEFAFTQHRFRTASGSAGKTPTLGRVQDGEDSHGRREPLSASATSIGSSEWSALCPEHPDQMTSLRRPMHPVPYPSFRNSIRFPRMVIRRTIRGRHPRMYHLPPGHPMMESAMSDIPIPDTPQPDIPAPPDPDIPAPDPEPGLQPPEPLRAAGRRCAEGGLGSPGRAGFRRNRFLAAPTRARCVEARTIAEEGSHATWNARLALSRSSSSSSCNELICLRSPRRRYIPA